MKQLFLSLLLIGLFSTKTETAIAEKHLKKEDPCARFMGSFMGGVMGQFQEINCCDQDEIIALLESISEKIESLNIQNSDQYEELVALLQDALDNLAAIKDLSENQEVASQQLLDLVTYLTNQIDYLIVENNALQSKVDILLWRDA